MNFLKLALNGMLMLWFSFAFAQNNDVILFKSGNYTPSHNVEAIVQQSHVASTELVNNKYYRLLHFSNIPGNAAKEEMKNAGIELLQYIPRNTFYASIQKEASLHQLIVAGVIGIEKIVPVFKLSDRLAKKEYPEWAMFGNEIALNAVFHKDITITEITTTLEDLGATVIMINEAQTVQFKVKLDQLTTIYDLPHFYYFEEKDAPEEPEGIVDRTNHRSNAIATDFTGGLKYDGTGITLMLQDNSKLDQHIDYTGRFTNMNATQSGDHGEHCGGIIGAAGNLDPKGRGMAFGAEVLVYSSSNNNFNSVANLYNNSNLTITSKSYGNGLNAGYTSLARTLDQQVRTMPSLIHVFSCGNSGTSDGGYGAGSGWGNITGGHKQGKNVIAVGNVSASDALASSSSRGPAADGRIKPDICAVGTNVYSTLDPNNYQNSSGTSMACPGVAGSLAQLYQAYKTLNGGANPNSGLMKAAILNTAEDLGNEGPDYKYGWGRINVRRAYELISSNNYLSSSVSQGGSNPHNINVPAGTKQLRVMVYWTDYEAAASASVALINDLNMQVIDPNSTLYLPWVLDETPNASNLNSPATRGVDNLNNMEQVTIDNPTAGMHTVNINGSAVPQGPQTYYIVYQFVVDEVVVTYPIGGEGFAPGTTETLRWDTNDDFVASTITLEYTTDNGVNWNTIAAGAPGMLRSYNWTIPNDLTGQAKLRITQGAYSDESDGTFSIIGTPTNLSVDWACPDSLKLIWDPVAGATGYEVYLLGNKYMDSQGTTTTTDFTVATPSSVTSWLSVRALGPANAKGERAIAIEKSPGNFLCTIGIESFDRESSIQLYPNPAYDQLYIDGLSNIGDVEVTMFNSIGEKVLEENIKSSNAVKSFNVAHLQSGIYIVKVVTANNILVERFVKE